MSSEEIAHKETLMKQKIGRYFVIKSKEELIQNIWMDMQESDYNKWVESFANRLVKYDCVESIEDSSFSTKDEDYLFFESMIEREVTPDADPEYFL